MKLLPIPKILAAPISSPGPAGSRRPGVDAPYANYELGKPYDEMFAPRRQGARALCGAGFAAFDPAAGRTEPPPAGGASRASCTRASPSPSIATTRRPNGSFPPTCLPRIVTAPEWDRIERGLTQRIIALNLFLRDIYNDGRVLKDGVVPRSMIYGSKHYRREMRGLPVPHGAYVNICGSDLIRNEAGDFVVLEDNLRVPSGVSYMLANRDVARRAFPAVFRSMGVRPDRALSAGAAGDAALADAVTMKTSPSPS